MNQQAGRLPAAYWPHRFPEVFDDNVTCTCGRRCKTPSEAFDHLDAIYGPPRLAYR